MHARQAQKAQLGTFSSLQPVWSSSKPQQVEVNVEGRQLKPSIGPYGLVTVCLLYLCKCQGAELAGRQQY